MTPDEFKAFANAAAEFVASYLADDCRHLPVLPSIQPGYLSNLLPTHLPDVPEDWRNVLADFKTKILPGITHWQSPNFHAYYPTQTSFPAIVGEILSAGLGIVGFNWIASPACTELEVIIMDWLAKFLNLPSNFLFESKCGGGGVLQGSASEAILVGILAAREHVVRQLAEQGNGNDETKLRGQLVMYTSEQANSCVEKNAKLAGIKCRLLKTEGKLRGNVLEKAILQDLDTGLIPIICVATMGTTGTCDFDDIDELTDVCKRYGMFIHVDAAYAGAAFCLPEYSCHTRALRNVDFFNFNLHKMMNVNFDCTAMWIAQPRLVEDAFNVERIYLKNIEENTVTPNFRHWQIPLGRRFRALKVWITLRVLGAATIRDGVRNRFTLAEYFNKLLVTDSRVRVVHKARMGLVTFCLKTGNEETENLLKRINDGKLIYLTPIMHAGKFIIRFVVGGFEPTAVDMDFAFRVIQQNIQN